MNNFYLYRFRILLCSLVGLALLAGMPTNTMASCLSNDLGMPYIYMSRSNEGVKAEFRFTGNPNKICWELKIKNGPICDGGCNTGFDVVSEECITSPTYYLTFKRTFFFNTIGVPDGTGGHSKLRIRAFDTKCNHESPYSAWYTWKYYNPHK